MFSTCLVGITRGKYTGSEICGVFGKSVCVISVGSPAPCSGGWDMALERGGISFLLLCLCVCGPVLSVRASMLLCLRQKRVAS